MKQLRWLVVSFFITLGFYSLFSYSLTDPNLILTNWSPYWNFQQWMWQTFFHNAELLTTTYLSLIIFLFSLYGGIIFSLKKIEQKSGKTLQKLQKNPWKLIVYFLLIIAPLLISYNTLSHDVFNYIFNAKIVTYFKADPHIKVALDYGYDDWTRFMHNTHTPAPYGYGWTVMSLLPYSLGMGKFLPTWLVFRLFEVLGVILLFKILRTIYQRIYKKPIPLSSLALLFLNPLFLIEIIGNMHNDLWMMVPALGAFALLIKKPKKNWWLKILLVIILIGISISTKMATLVLLPLLLMLALSWRWKWLQKILPAKTLVFLASLAMFVPLLTTRSQQFLPWYLIWALVWIPLLPTKIKIFKKSLTISIVWWQTLLIGFSFSGLARYIPWLTAGGFDNAVLTQQKLILWSLPVGVLLVSWASEKLFQLFKKNPLQ